MLSGVQGRGCGGLKRYSKSCSKTYLRKNRPRYPVALNVGRRDTLSTLMGFRDSKLELSMLLILSIGLALISSTALFPHTNHPSHFTAQPTTSTTPSVMSVVTGNDSTLYWNDNFTSTTSSWKSLDGSSNYAPGLCSSGPGKVSFTTKVSRQALGLPGTKVQRTNLRLLSNRIASCSTTFSTLLL